MAYFPENVLARLKALSCEDVAQKLNISVKRHRALCFMHEDHHPSLAFLGANRNSWYCFVCNKGGNAIDLVKESEDCGFVEACSWLCKEYNIEIDSSIPVYKPRKKKIQLKQFHKDEEKPFVKEVALFLIETGELTDTARHFLFDERKLSPEVINDLKIVSIDNGYDIVNKLKAKFDDQILKDSGLVSNVNDKLYFRFFTPCLLFPYYNQKKELIGLQSRYLGTNKEAPRFQFVSSQKTRLFNLPILNTLRKNEELFISEGITDCLALLSSGKKAVAIPSATILPQLDLSLLSDYKLHMVPDSDEAGDKAFVKLQCFFINRNSFLTEEKLPEGMKDYSEYYKILFAD